MKPVIFDRFATPFAVVENKESCVLSLHADDWAIEPPVRKNDNKTDPKRGIQIDSTGRTARRLGPGIKPYCVYKWKKAGLPTRDDFRAIGASPDKAIIGGTPSAARGEVPKLPASVWQPLEKMFAHQAHGIQPNRWRALVQRHIPPGTMPVRVAVVDATPVGLAGLDPSLHGTVVSYVVGTLLCGDPRKPECAQRVRPYLALPMKTAVESDPRGGYWGTFFQLADALGQVLADWNPEAERLVINLSLGWDPLKLDENDVHQKRVLALLEQASCLGAITVAASGNPTGSDGAIYPGRFEELPAPSVEACEKRGIKVPGARREGGAAKRPAFASGEPYSPLVHSVGAVDNRDQRLASNRRWGQPRLAAFGLSVTVPGRTGMPYLPPFTGTSMSTAVVSGVAAAVWSLRPELTASEVMALVYRGGVALDGAEESKRAQTEYCAGQHFGCEPRAKVHRVYLCGAVAQALQDAAPVEKLPCDEGISTAFPAWPATAVTAVAKGPCRIANCGLPVGPVSDQMAGADVAPHGGVAECPGCTVAIIGGVPVLTGTPTPPDDIAGLDPELRILITGRYNDAEFIVSPGPTFNAPMNITGMTMPAKPQGAVLTFSYWVGNSIYRTDPSFSIPFIK